VLRSLLVVGPTVEAGHLNIGVVSRDFNQGRGSWVKNASFQDSAIPASFEVTNRRSQSSADFYYMRESCGKKVARVQTKNTRATPNENTKLTL
jgi:hypothetical protein